MWYIDTGNVIKSIGLTNFETGADVNDATITGNLYKLPAFNPDAAVAVDKGGGKIGIPATTHGLSSGDTIRIEDDPDYRGVHVLDILTSINELVITATYVAKTFTGEESIFAAVVVDVSFSYVNGSNGDYVGKIAYDTPDPPLVVGAAYVLCIKEVSGGEQVLLKVFDKAGYKGR